MARKKSAFDFFDTLVDAMITACVAIVIMKLFNIV